MNKHKVRIYPGESGWLVVEAVDLPCVSQGMTKEEALTNIKEAIELYLESVKEYEQKHKSEFCEVMIES